MLEVQKYLLAGKTHDDLHNELGINLTRHPTKPLVILNYDQIDSPKTNPVVRECRGLILNSLTHELVARSFRRFFNWGELQDEMARFDFTNFVVETKEDGSLANIYNFGNEWCTNTRGSFAQDNMEFQDFTWEQGMLRAMGVQSRSDLDRVLPNDVNYVCEFCSPWNKVVRRYEEPQMFLLTAFSGIKELTPDECDELAKATHHVFRRPERFHFTSMEQVQEYLTAQAAADPTYEGVVIRDPNDRWKLKSPTYLGLHRMKGNNNIWNPKHLLPFIMTGESDELLTYFPEVEKTFREYEGTVQEAYKDLELVMHSTQGIEVQKDYALAIKGRTPFTGTLFTLRREHGPTIPPEALKKAWRDCGDVILKNLFKRQIQAAEAAESV